MPHVYCVTLPPRKGVVFWHACKSIGFAENQQMQSEDYVYMVCEAAVQVGGCYVTPSTYISTGRLSDKLFQWSTYVDNDRQEI